MRARCVMGMDQPTPLTAAAAYSPAYLLSHGHGDILCVYNNSIQDQEWEQAYSIEVAVAYHIQTPPSSWRNWACVGITGDPLPEIFLGIDKQ